ncbi:MAG: hypothetical protein U0945_08170 [Flavobacterium sp.]|nr:hypothetical protein [Candidatus Chromulinivorax sp.]MDZ4330546.1 hypothetical protein [Flavobacterium sp.]
MKKHKNLIRLIVITAALVACGVIAFKYMRTHKNIEKVYQSDQIKDANFDQIQQDKSLQQAPVDITDEVEIQKREGSCLPINSKCSSSSEPCCKPLSCNSGYCLGT